jgi:hypothetical protein
MMKRAVLAALVAAFSFQCASRPRPSPTPRNPIAACVVSCPDGFSFRRQHLCRAGRRHFEEGRAIGENVTRGADGGILSAFWIFCIGQWKPDGTCTETADYPKEDVELQSCSSLIHSIDSSREPSERGRREGEPLPWNLPANP